MSQETDIPAKRDLRKGRTPAKKKKKKRSAAQRRPSRKARLRRALATKRIDARKASTLKSRALRKAAKASARLSIVPFTDVLGNGRFARAFSAHPPLDRRIALLAALSRQIGERAGR